MYDSDRLNALTDEQLLLVLGDMGLDPANDAGERAACDEQLAHLRAMSFVAADGSLRVPPHEFGRLMHAQQFLRGESGRYWVALSLREVRSHVAPACMRACMRACVQAGMHAVTSAHLSHALPLLELGRVITRRHPR